MSQQCDCEHCKGLERHLPYYRLAIGNCGHYRATTWAEFQALYLRLVKEGKIPDD